MPFADTLGDRPAPALPRALVPATTAPRAASPRLAPAPPRVADLGGDRRSEPRRALADRRLGPPDRRTGTLLDARPEPVDRRWGPKDRRAGRPSRRLGHDRRRQADGSAALGAHARPESRTAIFWGVQLVAWIALAVLVLVLFV